MNTICSTNSNKPLKKKCSASKSRILGHFFHDHVDILLTVDPDVVQILLGQGGEDLHVDHLLVEQVLVLGQAKVLQDVPHRNAVFQFV